MKKYLIVILIIFFCSEISFSQNENNIWHFGYNAGVDFASGVPVAISNGQTMAGEGTATLSDSGGKLMFYTDGLTVWDSTHNPMPNGTGLFGGSSSTQSALIVPQPGSSTIYFIFTTDDSGGPNGCCYSIVDMGLNGGLGDVTVKNFQLQNQTTEKIIATRKNNGVDYWVITHLIDNDAFQVFPLTAAGVGVPITTNIGSIHWGNSCFGQMSYSCPYNKVALVVRITNTVDLLDFDPATGILTNPCNISNLTGVPYGLAFSPNGSFLYILDSQALNLFQFDISSGVAQTINNSSQLIGSVGGFGSLQLAVNDKIYIANYGTSFISVINNPDVSGSACNFVDHAVPVIGTVYLGLQNFPGCAYSSSSVLPTASFISPNQVCPGICIDFDNTSTGASSYTWLFPGAIPSTSTNQDPLNICYSTPGTYDVTLIASNANGSDTLTLQNYITVFPQPNAQSITQNGDTLFAIAGAASYQWYFNGSIMNGATDYFYLATQSGDYNVIATDTNGCEVEAVINNVLAGLTPALSKGEGVTAFPNPVNETINVRGLGTNSADEVSIYNVVGEKVFSAVDCKLPIVNCQLFPGLYYIEIISDKKIYRTKFVKSTYQ